MQVFRAAGNRVQVFRAAGNRVQVFRAAGNRVQVFRAAGRAVPNEGWMDGWLIVKAVARNNVTMPTHHKIANA